MDELSVTRMKPGSMEAERSVIGAMIMDRDAVDAAGEILQREDFYHPQYALLFETILELQNDGQTVDIVTLLERLRGKGAPVEVADPAFLGEVADAVPIAANVRTYAQIVKQKSLLRQIIDMNQEIENLCYEQAQSVEDILDRTEQSFLAILQKRGISDFVPIDKIVRAAVLQIEEAYNKKGAVTGIPTGFIDLDRMTAGLQPSDMILIAARPSMGKTAFALNIAAHVAIENGLTTAIFSLEMSKEQLVSRLFAMEAGIEAQKLRVGALDDMDWAKLVDGAGLIAESKLIIDDTPAISISELRSKCRKYKQESDLKLVVIDYLQLMTTSGRAESRQQEVSDISRSLKALARELNVPVIAVSQLNRGVEQRDDKRPMLSDLRDSGAIEQDADVVMLLYRDEYYNKDTRERGISEVIVAKQRNGPTGTVQLAWLAEYTRFRNREGAKIREQED